MIRKADYGMAVKRSQSASRVLSVVELLAEHQPSGVSALAKLLSDDRSAVQRAVLTLADAGWIRAARDPPMRWELTPRVFAIAHLPDRIDAVRQRARGALEILRDQTAETILLAVPDGDCFVVIEAAESPHLLRTASRVGRVIPPRESATGRAFLAYVDARRQAEMLGGPPTDADLAEFARTRARGYGLNAGDILPGATSLAAPIFDGRGQPVAALVVSGPSERIAPERYDVVGELVAKAAAALSTD